MRRYSRRVAAGVVAVTGAVALSAISCSGGDVVDPTATAVPPVQQVAGDLSYQDLLPPSRQGIAPSIQEHAVTRVATTPTPRPEVSEALAQRIAKQEFAREGLRIRFPDVEPAGTFLATRRLLIVLSGVRESRFSFSSAGDPEDRFWVVNFRVVGPVNLPAQFVGAVIDARSGDVANVFIGEAAPLPPPGLP
ncbi:MAG: hypothetical protein IH868_01080 [Chloroflexi bacterium]|nr:hypothetical protein [Chloroflexota bacterium]